MQRPGGATTRAYRRAVAMQHTRNQHQEGNPVMGDDQPYDPTGTQTKAGHRAAHVNALQNELEFLEAQPEPNEARVAAVREQLDKFSAKPKGRRRETAADQGAPVQVPDTSVSEQHAQGVPGQTPSTPDQQAQGRPKAPAKKTAASQSES